MRRFVEESALFHRQTVELQAHRDSPVKQLAALGAAEFRDKVLVFNLEVSKLLGANIALVTDKV